MRFELTASPLPRECATPAPQGHIFNFHDAHSLRECFPLRKCSTIRIFFGRVPAPQGHFKFSTVRYGLRTLRLLTATACVLRTPLPSTSLAKLTLGSFVSGSAPQGHIFNFHDTLVISDILSVTIITRTNYNVNSLQIIKKSR